MTDELDMWQQSANSPSPHRHVNGDSQCLARRVAGVATVRARAIAVAGRLVACSVNKAT
jgi:hypothetical protein